MGLISLLASNPVAFFILVPVLLYSVIIHEIAHGWVASRFGDNTAKYSGRLSFHPASHIDPMGAIAIFLVGFGWAKPVPVTYSNLSPSRRGIISVALAGCVVNILIAIVALFLLQFPAFNSNSLFAPVLYVVARINLVLASLNLIPIPPLDGSRVLMEFLPTRAKYKLAVLEPYGFFIIMGLLWTGLLTPIISFMQGAILVFIRILF